MTEGVSILPLRRASPSLAVVFGSGGLPAIAGLGVVDVIRQDGLVPDLYAGSGAGALFAALLAGGRSVEDSVVLASRLWVPLATVQRRWLAALSLVWPSLAGRGMRFSLLREGPIVGRLERAFGRTRIEDLPIALRICATDAVTGERVVLRSGRLSDALRASMAQPMLLPPVPVEGRMLIAGAQSDPLPVGAVRDARCAVAVLAPRLAPIGPETLLDRLQATMAAQAGQLIKSSLQAAHRDGMRLLTVVAEPPIATEPLDGTVIARLVGLGRRVAEPRIGELRALATQASYASDRGGLPEISRPSAEAA